MIGDPSIAAINHHIADIHPKSLAGVASRTLKSKVWHRVSMVAVGMDAVSVDLLLGSGN